MMVGTAIEINDGNNGTLWYKFLFFCHSRSCTISVTHTQIHMPYDYRFSICSVMFCATTKIQFVQRLCSPFPMPLVISYPLRFILRPPGGAPTPRLGTTDLTFLIPALLLCLMTNICRCAPTTCLHRESSSSSFSPLSVSNQDVFRHSAECRSPAFWQCSDSNTQSL